MVVMALCPRHNMVWCDATVPVVMALLAQWWFTNRPVRRGLTVAFVVISYFSRGIVVTVRG
jgi:hypothetical protein